MGESELDAICTRLANRVAGEAAMGLGQRWRCPSGLREEIVAYAVACRENGEALAPISERLGLIEATLARWLRQRKKNDGLMRGFRSVAIVPSEGIQRSSLRTAAAADHRRTAT